MLRFDPTTPTELQRQDWTCSIRSTMWVLKSLGIDVTPEDAQDSMSPRFVRSDVGLLNADGSGLVTVLKERWGLTAVNHGSVTFEEVAALAGKTPVMVGLRNWGLNPDQDEGHWSAVRGFDGTNLLLANPAGTGPKYGQQSLNRQQFEARGGASMVYVPLEQGSATEVTLPGIDVASWQGLVDWAAVAASGQAAFAFTKATGGTQYVNPTLVHNWKGIREHGLVRGAYHYAFESTNQPLPGEGPISEAKFFVENLEKIGGFAQGDLLALDLEDGEGNLGEWALSWLITVEQLTGIRPFVYTGAWFAGPHGLASRPALSNYPLWLAAYRQVQPSAPAPWSSVDIWQYTAKGSVPGIKGDVDLNRFNGTLDELRALGKGASVVPPFQFVFGFGQLALELGPEHVGEPLENEHPAERNGHPIQHQLTTRGEMVYWTEHNRSHFYPSS